MAYHGSRGLRTISDDNVEDEELDEAHLTDDPDAEGS